MKLWGENRSFCTGNIEVRTSLFVKRYSSQLKV
jgi:hypothetical protein